MTFPKYSLVLASPFLLAIACGSGSSDESADAPDSSATDADASDADGADAEDSDSADSDGVGGDGDAQAGPLFETYEDYFPIGTAFAQGHLSSVKNLLDRDFNHFTCENAMKWQSIQASEGVFTFEEADVLADYARSRGVLMTGHAFIWHRQVPAWVFAGLTPENPDSIDTIKTRMQAHTNALVERYGDVVDNWDVVNEALSDDTSKVYRDGAEGSQWYEYFGSEDYVYWAFVYAKEALEAREAGSSEGKLYYNDYSMTLKVDNAITMLDAVRAKGAQVDGIGLQAHWQIHWPSAADVEATIKKIIDAGYKVKISELDLSVYSDYPTGTFMPEPYKELTPALEAEQAQKFAELFAIFRKYKDDITSVTFWGVSDDATWLDDEPVPGRDNYPLLFDANHEPKDAYFAIQDF